MEAAIRKPYQGVYNIVRFNWHFYALAATVIAVLLLSGFFLPVIKTFLLIATAVILLTIFISLAVSFYIYDLSPLYKLNWLNSSNISPSASIVNINAGFDETSELLRKKFPAASLRVADFYDADKHTEVSIKRARKTYPAFADTERIKTVHPFLDKKSTEKIFLILAAHEIRDGQERIIFFSNLQKALKENGEIIVVEHLRDFANFLAYNFGFFHFFSKKEWKNTFKAAALSISSEKKITPFITVFTLKKNGTAS